MLTNDERTDDRVIASMDEYRNRYFPKQVEAERLAKLTPRELGQEWARRALESQR